MTTIAERDPGRNVSPRLDGWRVFPGDYTELVDGGSQLSSDASSGEIFAPTLAGTGTAAVPGSTNAVHWLYPLRDSRTGRAIVPADLVGGTLGDFTLHIGVSMEVLSLPSDLTIGGWIVAGIIGKVSGSLVTTNNRFAGYIFEASAARGVLMLDGTATDDINAGTTGVVMTSSLQLNRGILQTWTDDPLSGGSLVDSAVANDSCFLSTNDELFICVAAGTAVGGAAFDPRVRVCVDVSYMDPYPWADR